MDRFLPKEIWSRSELPGSEYLILIALAVRCDEETGVCRMTTEGFLEVTSIKSRQTVQNAIAGLVEKGLISKEVVRSQCPETLKSFKCLEFTIINWADMEKYDGDSA